MAPRQVLCRETRGFGIFCIRRRIVRLQHPLGRRQGDAQVRVESHRTEETQSGGNANNRRTQLQEIEGRREGNQAAEHQDVLLSRSPSGS